MASFFTDFGLMWYLEELKKKEFVKFKEFLKQEILQLGLKQVSWTEVKKASRQDLANLLLKHYEEKQAWDITFRFFQKINREDLIERAKREIDGHPKLYRAHLKTKLTHDSSRVFNISIQDFLKEEITENDYYCFENLFQSKGTELKPPVVFLSGVAGTGKTLILKRLMLAWIEGLVFPHKFSYLFYFCCQVVKQLKTASLAELISREWPGPSAPIEEILSEPEKLLFIIDSLEGMECDLFKGESELCDNCMEKQPVNVLLSSLLSRKMLPESSFLISTTPETLEIMVNRIEYTHVKIVTGLKESNMKMCFHRLFQDRNMAREVFSLVRENEQLFTKCQVPVLCWMVANCLKEQIEKGQDPVSICRCTTSLYTTHIFNLFIPKSAQYPSKKSQDQLHGLCSLAAEGMWTDTFVFGEEALRRNGIINSDIPTLLDIGMLVNIRECENSYLFLHPSIQEVCAAIFYLLKSHVDHPTRDVKSIETLMFTFLKKVKVQWNFLGCFIFGLLHESEQKKLEAFFGHQLSQEVKHQLCQCLETISGNAELQEEIDGMKLFYCLFEMEDEAFLVQAMNCVEQIHFVAKNYSDVVAAAYCLKHCSTLKKLSLSTQNILKEEQGYREKLLTGWNHICSVFLSSKGIQELQMKDTSLNKPAFSILYNNLKYCNSNLKVLMVNNVFLCEKYFFFELIHYCNLQYLNLSLTFLSHSDVKLLCDVLNQAECNIEKLVLANCSLSEQCWDCLSEVLRWNKTLSHLDISSNALKDEGLKVLCGALTLPDSVLKSLRLEACELTDACCEDLASTFTHCKTLWGLNLLENALDYSGLVVLCEALKQQMRTTFVLGLRITDFNPETQEFLVAEEEKNPCLRILSGV
ncbi:NACHT, LRR and PYD domains-containing protein 4A-like isoform X2 [Arvicanthis niloticus]|uniref:NACHT, LRR and PYD domains-containing protein 4A-like isoform X2 n=1 Tax=Arvicanthis niloticus TaxID=61156 RepID=UPI0014866DFD|nr:NACHT, LRR and PYD domains-containing protein 4A-like isoform X2 [Arvicanthis niloticus]